MNNIETVRAELIRPKKIQLHSGMEGFDSPDAFGIYRHSGGKPLGVVGSVYEPPDLNLFLDSIVQSVEKCADWLDLDKLEYSELKGGAKVRISLPGPEIQVKNKMVGDILRMRLDFMTGFDGLTKTSLNFFSYRLWCSNGAGSWMKDIDLAFKNTPGNQGKWLLFCDQLIQVLESTKTYTEFLNTAVTREVTQSQIDKFYKDLLGYSQQDHKELTTRKRNILDRINQTTAIEMQNTGANLYSLLQGVTRYTSHELAQGDMDKLLTDNPATLNRTAHKLVAAMMAN